MIYSNLGHIMTTPKLLSNLKIPYYCLSPYLYIAATLLKINIFITFRFSNLIIIYILDFIYL